jgi:hypothetical protein
MASFHPRRGRFLRFSLAAVLTAALSGCGSDPSPIATPAPTPTPSVSATPVSGDPIVGAAGDIACGPTTPPGDNVCRYMETSNLLMQMNPTAVLVLGDIQYETGRLVDFLRFYEPSWGRLKAITRPAPGNHEYQETDGQGYFDYFNGVSARSGSAGLRGEGWYAFSLGSWRVIALNSNCMHVGGCEAGSRQERWLREELRANHAPCTLAYWHHPRFSSGPNGNTPEMAPFWAALEEAGADVILVGHEHSYERFAPQTARGLPSARGPRQFTVGTGGHSLRQFVNPQPNSESKYVGYGVLQLRLKPDGYDWKFVPVGTTSFSDSGSAPCI